MHEEPLGVALPAGRHFAVTWGISDHYAGMTSALLHRSRAFVRLGRVSVDILTVDARPDYPELSKHLRERGELTEGMRIVNVWDWLRANDPAEATGRRKDTREKRWFDPLPADDSFTSRYRGGTELSRTHFADDGTTGLQTDHYRLDGSLFVSERRDTRSYRLPGAGSVVLCDRHGQPVRSFNGTWALYRYWLDELRGGIRSFFIVDSKAAANFMLSYRRRDAVTVHLVHSSHLQGLTRPIGPLRESRRMVFENLDDFDAVVLLTTRQRDDVVLLLGQHSNLAVVPNSRDLGPAAPVQRQRGRGIVLATLDDRKRVDHAVRAAIAAAEANAERESGEGEQPVTLDVFGEGPKQDALAKLIGNRGSIVRLHDYRADAREQLRESSFLLLTSRSEGFPLVLIESMAAGCIPIAYDVPYGPSDIIRHGENGFLVTAGDRAGVAEAILELQFLPEEAVQRMRSNARRTAVQYSDEAVMSMWARELHRASLRKRPPLLPAGARVVVQSARMAVRHQDLASLAARARASCSSRLAPRKGDSR